ncbi:hypothetical protein GGTG_12756 [Gaeumannomyces tritici R3-111a-1]|uniref:Uncharacterized protein n=1 Tax=Gaeumannomyces tritici (strain R3-111a-1) TaxID=644352 RepID=J3PGX6_GAET3|nr:hypothetical protein GGTG_12756 [Gaeumannomyces tritici R3-111a-1]EJT69873.1 hypothetical protein GGTG_12756 [Gaeumannomyces tritici R3-111a-1]
MAASQPLLCPQNIGRWQANRLKIEAARSLAMWRAYPLSVEVARGHTVQVQGPQQNSCSSASAGGVVVCPAHE